MTAKTYIKILIFFADDLGNTYGQYAKMPAPVTDSALQRVCWEAERMNPGKSVMSILESPVEIPFDQVQRASDLFRPGSVTVLHVFDDAQCP